MTPEMSRNEQQLLIILRLCQAKNVVLEKGQQLVVKARFKGESLSSDPVDSSVNPLINTELAWVVTRKELQELRLQKAPIKVELYSVCTMEKKLLGYCILDPRSASIDKMEQKWYKVVGTKPPSHPILLLVCLALEIEEETRFVTGVAPPELSFNGLETSNQPVLPAREQFDESLKPILVNGEFFQIGPTDKCTETFSFSVTVVFAENLPLLLPDAVSNWPHIDSKYFFYFSLLGCDITTEPFQNVSYPDFLAEKATAKIRSSIDLLKKFFEFQKAFEIQFCCDDHAIGYAHLDLSPLSEKIGNEIYLKPASISGQFPLKSTHNSKIPENSLGHCPLVGLSLTISAQQDTLPSEVVNEVTDDKKTQVNESLMENAQQRYMAKLKPETKEELEETQKPESAEEQPLSSAYAPKQGERLVVVETNSSSALHRTRKVLEERPLFLSPISKSKRAERSSSEPEGVPVDSIVSLLNELDDWRNQQMQKMKNSLEAEEMRRLDLLLTQWRQQYSLWESALRQRMKKCSDLETHAKELVANLIRREEDLKKVELEFERSRAEVIWKSNEAQADADRRCATIKQDYEHKVSLEQEKVKILQNEIKHLRSKESDNPMILDLQTKLARLTTDKENLEEQLKHVRQSKLYYKEQWLRAVDKVENPFCPGQQSDLYVTLKQKDAEIEHLKSLLFSGSSRHSTEDRRTSSSGKNDSPLVNAAIQRGIAAVGLGSRDGTATSFRRSRAGTDTDIKTIRPKTTEVPMRSNIPDRESRPRSRQSRARSAEARKRPLTNSEKTIRPPSATRRSLVNAAPHTSTRPTLTSSSLNDIMKEIETLENTRKSMLRSGHYKDTDTVIVRTDAKIANLKQAIQSE